VPAPFSITVFL